jgi:hypothetical protein
MIASKSFYASGLGLYTCRKIIYLHRGGIWAQNNPPNEKGATFTFSLRLIDSSKHLKNCTTNKVPFNLQVNPNTIFPHQPKSI